MLVNEFTGDVTAMSYQQAPDFLPPKSHSTNKMKLLGKVKASQMSSPPRANERSKFLL